MTKRVYSIVFEAINSILQPILSPEGGLFNHCAIVCLREESIEPALTVGMGESIEPVLTVRNNEAWNCQYMESM